MKINYQLKTDEILKQLAGQRPSLLLHSCCAPCSSYVLEYLRARFQITVFYYNPNISPEEEYRRRAAEQKRLLGMPADGNQAEFLEGPYESDAFEALARGHEAEPEGGPRCSACYELRLRKTAETAKALGFSYFTTTLSVSPYKNAEKLNEIGRRLSEETGVPFLYADFKKRNGYLRSIELSRQYGLYRQNYCGCRFSRAAAEARQKPAADTADGGESRP